VSKMKAERVADNAGEGMRELSAEEVALISGASWQDVGSIFGGIGAIAAGTAYTLKTGGIGGYLGGGALIAGGVAAIGSGFDGLRQNWYGGS